MFSEVVTPSRSVVTGTFTEISSRIDGMATVVENVTGLKEGSLIGNFEIFFPKSKDNFI